MLEEKPTCLIRKDIDNRSKKIRIVYLSLFLVICLSLAGCRLSYIFHAASGQLHLVNNSIPLDDALEGDTLSVEEKERLKLVNNIKKFGEQELGLRTTDNYQTVYIESRRPPIYAVSASPKDQLKSITWWFPIVGRMPYLCFFDMKKAQEKQEDLINKGLDVIISIADAYSTLGWFKDPVTLNLLDGTEVDLTEIILHEMTHTTLYLKGQSEFNEGLANLIGKMGAIAFLENKYGQDHPLSIKARNNLQDNRIFSRFLTSLLEKLDECYASPISYQEKLDAREKIFNTAIIEFSDLKGIFQTDRYSYFGKSNLNNAYLLSIGLYNRHFFSFEMLLNKKNGSIRSTLELLTELSKKDGDMIAEIEKLFE